MVTNISTAMKIVKANGNKMVTLVRGPSGAGKTHALTALFGGSYAEDPFEGRAIVVPCTFLVQEDPAGYPSANGDNVKLLVTPYFASVLECAAANPKKAVGLILDELPQASPDVQLALCSIIYDRTLCGSKLPENVMIVATGNRKQDSSGANSGFAHLTNRMLMLEIEHDFKGWMEWAMEQGNIRPDVLAFLKSKPSALYLSTDPASGNEKEIERDQYREASKHWRPFPSERAWTRVSELINRYEKSKLPDEVILTAVAGVVGEERAHDFMATRKIVHRLPERADLLEGRANWPDDSEPLLSWACAIREAQLTNQGELAKSVKAMKNTQSEICQMFIHSLEARLKGKGETLLSWDGVDDLLSDATRFGRSILI